MRGRAPPCTLVLFLLLLLLLESRSGVEQEQEERLTLDLAMLAGPRLLGHMGDRLAAHLFDVLAMPGWRCRIFGGYALLGVRLIRGLFGFRPIVDVDLGALHAHSWLLTSAGPELP